MINRLKNLFELSKFKPEETADEVVLKKDMDERPRGKARVVGGDEEIIDRIFEQ